MKEVEISSIGIVKIDGIDVECPINRGYPCTNNCMWFNMEIGHSADINVKRTLVKCKDTCVAEILKKII